MKQPIVYAASILVGLLAAAADLLAQEAVVLQLKSRGEGETMLIAKQQREIIKANIEIPSGTLIFEDPPIHDIHRSLLVRVFTPRRVAALEPLIRQFCARSLDPPQRHLADGQVGAGSRKT